MTKFLFKANNDVLSFCECENPMAMSTGQLDCPWCGCGWLISCSVCKKAFTFGIIQETDLSMFEIGQREAQSRGLKNISEQEIQDWADAMTEDFDKFSVGQIVVYFDGQYFPIEADNIDFEGYFAKHNLPKLPHSIALNEPNYLYDFLTDTKYWLDREIPDIE